MVQGINKEFIFKEEEEIKKYILILSKYQQEFKLMIVAYCIMNNHAHILIYSDEINEVSKFMRRVNTKYAIYYNNKHNRCGYVFRNRYRAEEIYTEAHLISCIKYIHNNPVKANMCKCKKDYKYSSYNNYINKNGFINENIIRECFESNGIDYKNILEKECESFKFIEYQDFEETQNCKEKVLRKFIEERNITLDEVIKNNVYLKEIVFILYMEYNITQKEIGQILGLSRIKIHRIIKNEL